MAKYRRPVLPADNTYETASTIPAAASFQDVPPPSEETKGVRKAIPIPAMVTMDEIKDTSREAKEKGGEKEKEIIVQGVVIPPKPRPPKDDGTFTGSFPSHYCPQRGVIGADTQNAA